MPKIEFLTVVKADKKKVFETIKAMERFPEFMRDVKNVKIIEQKENRMITAWEADIEGVPVRWTEEDVFDDREMTCKFKTIGGDYKYEGIWKLEGNKNGKTNVLISADFDWGIPKLEKFIGNILEKKARRSLRSMLNAIAKELSNG